MTKIRANVIMAGVVGPTSTKASSGMMYIRAAPPWGKKSVVLANIPYTAHRPTAKQKAWRDTFADKASEAAAAGFSHEYDYKRNLPGTAAYIKDTLNTGKTAARRAQHGWKGEYSYNAGTARFMERMPVETGARVYPRRVRRY